MYVEEIHHAYIAHICTKYSENNFQTKITPATFIIVVIRYLLVTAYNFVNINFKYIYTSLGFEDINIFNT